MPSPVIAFTSSTISFLFRCLRSHGRLRQLRRRLVQLGRVALQRHRVVVVERRGGPRAVAVDGAGRAGEVLLLVQAGPLAGRHPHARAAAGHRVVKQGAALEQATGHEVLHT